MDEVAILQLIRVWVREPRHCTVDSVQHMQLFQKVVSFVGANTDLNENIHCKRVSPLGILMVYLKRKSL